MSGWDYITQNADWLSAVCGLLSAFVLSLPLIGELPKRRRHDRVEIIKQQPTPSARSGLEDDSDDVETVQREMTSDRMGGYYSAARTVAIGMGLLILSFAFALIYALNKS